MIADNKIHWKSDCCLAPVANVERIDANEVRGDCARCGKRNQWACDPLKLEPLTEQEREMMEIYADEKRYERQEQKAIIKELKNE